MLGLELLETFFGGLELGLQLVEERLVLGLGCRDFKGDGGNLGLQLRGRHRHEGFELRELLGRALRLVSGRAARAERLGKFG